jgi:tetratricopeptide (TPR) repeat protein
VVDALTGERASEHAGLPVLPAAYARSYLTMGLSELGDFAAALAVGNEAVVIADATGHLDTIQWACYAVGLAALDRGDAEGAMRSLERALSICRTAELPVYVPRTLAALGYAYTLAGRADGPALVESAAAESDAMSQRNIQPRILGRLAEVHVLSHKTDRALESAARSLALAREHGERGSEAHALRVLGLVHQAESRPDDARAACTAALALADELGMRPLAGLCHLALGRIERATDRREAARHHLTLARETFTHLDMTRSDREASAELQLLDSRLSGLRAVDRGNLVRNFPRHDTHALYFEPISPGESAEVESQGFGLPALETRDDVHGPVAVDDAYEIVGCRGVPFHFHECLIGRSKPPIWGLYFAISASRASLKS